MHRSPVAEGEIALENPGRRPPGSHENAEPETVNSQVSMDDLEEKIRELEEYVQNVDIAAMQKI